nr:zf-HC2 domain-containing protein [Lachnospiraceae bacterium]
MKCEIARDLLALYVDDLCSPETRKELEMHLKDCPECEKKLEHYRKELKVEENPPADTNESQTVEIEPMKKVKKKMKRSKCKVIALGVALFLFMGVFALLCIGEATNLWPGFTMIGDVIKIKSACKDLTEGETDKFMDLLAYHFEDAYLLKSTGAFEDMDAYFAGVEEDAKQAYEHYFEGKNVKVRINALYANPYNYAIAADDFISLIGIEFYDGDDILYTMEFTKVAHGKFTVIENSDRIMLCDEVSFTGGMLPYDDILLKITLPYSAQSSYRKLTSGEKSSMGAGLILTTKMPDEQSDLEFSGRKKEKIQKLVENGCYIKNVNYSLWDFDDEKSRWIYKIWITYEDQNTGCVFVVEQKLMYCSNKMYVMEGEGPVVTSVSSTTDKVSAENMELAVSLLQ